MLIAGTNGKGSTAAFLSSMLTAAGHRTGLFTSPHLLRFTERFTVDGEETTPERVAVAYERIQQAEFQCAQRPTFFECATAIAALLFAEAEVDIAVFEVGLGGRLDATNALPRVLSVITAIDLDHQHLLGETLEHIAAEKAGILTAGIPAVFGQQKEIPHKVLLDHAQRLGCDVFVASPASALGPGTLIDGPWGQALNIPNTLPGAYQANNLSTAATAAWVLNHRGRAMPGGGCGERRGGRPLARSISSFRHTTALPRGRGPQPRSYGSTYRCPGLCSCLSGPPLPLHFHCPRDKGRGEHAQALT